MTAALPRDVKVTLASDRSLTIRASLHDTERTLVIAVLLVTFIVFLFLGNPRAALIPAVAVPVSIIGTFGVMYLLGFSLDTLSLMALTIATGFVVDDAIVVLGKYHPLYRSRRTALSSCLAGRERSRLYCSFDQHFAHCGLFADLPDGRTYRPHVPRIRAHAVDRRSGVFRDFSHDNADALLADPESAGADGESGGARAGILSRCFSIL